MMKYFLRGFTLLALATLATGCLEVKMQFLVKKDGSGTMTLETLMTKASAERLAGLGGMGGKNGQDPIAQMKKELTDTSKLAKAAAQLGEGVKFIKATPIEKADGSFGVNAEFSFTDVTKLNMGKMNKGAAGGMGNLDMAFGFVKGATPKLTIKTKEAAKAKPNPNKKVPTDAELDMQLNMMSMMAAGMKMSVVIKVDGKIVKTNARYKGKKNDSILLMHMDMDKMLADKENMKKAIKMGMDDPSAFVKAGVKGMKMETPGKSIVIQFK